MIYIRPFSRKVQKQIKKYSVQNRLKKQIELFLQNHQHPSPHTELLEPKEYGIYSFRIDLKYRAIFIFHAERSEIEILAVTVHYK